MKNKILHVLLAAVIAIGLWVYVITVERPESESDFYNVSVVLEGANVLRERGMMVTSDTDLTVDLKLAGKRSDLNNLKSSDLAAVIDLSRITEAGDKKLSYSISIPGDSSIEVVSRKPDTVSLTVTEWASKEILVDLFYEGRVPDGYYVDRQSASVEYDRVTVTGPKDVVNQIEKARITLNLENRIETISETLRYALCDGEGNPVENIGSVTSDHDELRVTVSIQQLKILKLVYNVIDGGGLTAGDVEVTADYDTITVAGSTAALMGLEEINLGDIDLGEVEESMEMVLPIKLPEGVSNQSGFTVVHLQVKLPDLETRTYSVSRFRADHVPQGMTAEIFTQVLEVKIRGRAPILDRIMPEHITAVVDLTDEVAGMFSIPVTFEIEGYGAVDHVGAIEKYTVKGQLSEITPETPVTSNP